MTLTPFPFQVAAINAEIVDSAMAMKTLTHFFLGLTNEWLESMSTMLDAEKTDGSAQGGSAPKDSFPIQVSGCDIWKIVTVTTTRGLSADVILFKWCQICTYREGH